MDEDEIMAAVRKALRSEMRTLLERSPGADRRRLLDRAVAFQLDKLELRLLPKSEDPDTLRIVVRACFEQAANEMRATF
jgi:hypothetical protein